MSLRRQLIKSGKIRKVTRTSQFFLPIYGYSMERYTQYFINCYISNQIVPKIVFIFENDLESEQLDEIISVLMQDFLFTESWYDENDKEICIELELPGKYNYDFKSFCKGKYSEFTTGYKILLEKFYGKETSKDDVKVTMYDLLYPTQKKKQAIAKSLWVDSKVMPNEVFDSPDMEDEIYINIEELKNKYESAAESV